MANPKISFLKNLKHKAKADHWRITAFAWHPMPEGPMTGKVVEEVETNDIVLAALAAHHLIDKYGAGTIHMITVEISAIELVDGGLL